jgi:serine/threonine protein kinase
VIHRDIKPDNFLVGGQDGHTVKLIDFGLSVMVPKLGKVSGVFGTPPYMCPEMINKEYYDTKADVWSLGVMVYVFLFGTFPYDCKEPSSSAMKQAIVTGVPPSFLPSLKLDDSRNGYLRTKHAVQLVKALLDRNPMSRVSAKEALRQPWMTLSLNGQHRPGADLPSLRPMLNSAKLAGAFEFRDVSNTSSDDALLDEMQEERDPNSPKFKPKDAYKEEGWDISSLSTSCDEDCNCIAGAEEVGISNTALVEVHV